MRGVFVYISGPVTPKNGYSAEDNVNEGLKMHLKLTDLKIASYSPQLVAAFPSAWKVDWDKWMEIDLAIVEFCTHMVMLPRWRTSKGAVEEVLYAEKKGIPIFYSLESLLEILNDSGSKG